MTGGGVVGAGVTGVDITNTELWFIENRSSRSTLAWPGTGDVDISHEVQSPSQTWRHTIPLETRANCYSLRKL